MTQEMRVRPSTRAWSIGGRTCAWVLPISLVTTALLNAARGYGVGSLSPLAGPLVSRLLLAVVLGLPGAALLAALVGRRPTWLQVAAFAAVGGALGFGLARWALVPGTTAFAWLEAGLAAGAGRWLVAWRDARRGVAGTPGAEGAEGAGSTAGAPLSDGEGLRWEAPLAWLVASVGLLLVPAWSGFAAILTQAAFFGEMPDGQDRAQAATYLWFGAAVAVAATVTVVLLARRVGRRGERLRGGAALPTMGVLVAFVLAGVADTI